MYSAKHAPVALVLSDLRHSFGGLLHQAHLRDPHTRRTDCIAFAVRTYIPDPYTCRAAYIQDATHYIWAEVRKVKSGQYMIFEVQSKGLLGEQNSTPWASCIDSKPETIAAVLQLWRIAQDQKRIPRQAVVNSHAVSLLRFLARDRSRAPTPAPIN